MTLLTKQPIKMSKSPKPLLSPYFRKFVSQHKFFDGPILDLPCGYGRHTFELLKSSYQIVASDLDAERLRHIESKVISRVNPVLLQLDVINDPWPFDKDYFGAVINVHFFHASLFDKFAYSLKPNGLLYFESIENRGGNYEQLPECGELRNLLVDHFAIIDYAEKPAGPKGSLKTTVKAVARKN
jgi:SAM-dependent methyltransferase